MKLGQFFHQIRTLDPANAEYFGNELMHSLALRSRLYHGIAYVIDEDDTFKSRCNMAMVELEPVPEEEQIAEKEFGHYNNLETHGRVDVMADLGTMDAERLQKLIGDHARYTGSKRAAELPQWDNHRPLRRKVMPVEYSRALAEMAREKAATMQAAELRSPVYSRSIATIAVTLRSNVLNVGVKQNR